jgi:hypothetical protein
MVRVSRKWWYKMMEAVEVDPMRPIHDQSCCAKLFCATQVCPFTIKSISTIHCQSCCTTRNVAQHDWSCMGPFSSNWFSVGKFRMPLFTTEHLSLFHWHKQVYSRPLHMDLSTLTDFMSSVTVTWAFHDLRSLGDEYFIVTYSVCVFVRSIYIVIDLWQCSARGTIHFTLFCIC